MEWCQTDIENIPGEKHSIFFSCVGILKIHLQKLRRITSETSINEIHHMFNKHQIRQIRRKQKKLYMFCSQEFLNIPFCMLTGGILFKVISKNNLKERNESGSSTSLMNLLLLRLSTIRSSCNRPWCVFTFQAVTLGVHPLLFSVIKSRK